MRGIADINGRIDVIIPKIFDGISRSYAKKLISEGRIKVNNKVIAKASEVVVIGDFLCVEFCEPKPLEIVAEDLPLDIVYEDEDLLVINKPKGMVVHPANGNQTGTLVNAILGACGDSLSGINGVMRPGIVHRIDKNTSGLLLIAKNDEAHKSLAQQLKDHSINRKYLTIVNGKVQEEGTINAPIGRSAKDRKKMAVVENGRSAITHYKPIITFQIKGKTVTLLECRLETGRTHQIRVHMAHIGHHVLGDDVYGTKNAPAVKSHGQLLHAYLLGFVHPAINEYMEFTASPPKEFAELLPESLQLLQL